VLLSPLALGVAACARSPVPTSPTVVVARQPDFDSWTLEATGILSDVLQSLRTFDVFQAYRVGSVEESGARLNSGLAWDPPTGAAWDEATHVTRGVRGRAELLFQAVTTSRIDPSLWRERRRLGDATHDLLDLGDALGAYRTRIDSLPPGDGAAALGLLDQAWAQWDAVAARWSISRSESIPCAK
jgi:hypothetical protein